jgi:hypothetical protein
VAYSSLTLEEIDGGGCSVVHVYDDHQADSLTF